MGHVSCCEGTIKLQQFDLLVYRQGTTVSSLGQFEYGVDMLRLRSSQFLLKSFGLLANRQFARFAGEFTVVRSVIPPVVKRIVDR